MDNTNTGEQIASAIIDELTGRRGFDNAWDDCDEDIQQEIREAIAAIVVQPTAQLAPMLVAEKLMPMIEAYADFRFRLGTGQWTYEQRIELAAQADQARSALKSLLAASIAEMTTPRPRRSGESMKTVIRFVPYTPAGTPLDWLASDTESDAWKKLLEDAAHMPYKTIENFKKRGYVVEREKWTEKA